MMRKLRTENTAYFVRKVCMKDTETVSKFRETSEKLLDFIRRSPSVFHVVANMESLLKKAGYRKLQETEAWEIKPHGRYYVTRNESALIAFTVPEEADHFQVTAAHSDSPAFRLKDRPEMGRCGHYVQLDVEKYGGAVLAPWLDRPLSIAGRAIVDTGSGVESRLIHFDRDLCLIPNLAIHMNRKINEGYAYSIQNDMLPLFGDESADGKLEEMVAEQACAPKEKVLAADLFLYSRVPGSIWGASEEYISSGKLDDLQSAYGCLQGLIRADNTAASAVCVCAIFDNEEVGSRTKQGADSTFLESTLKRIALSSGGGEEDYLRMCSGSFMISADNAHAVHPLHAEKADPVSQPFMNRGPVVKYSANQKYTTDAVSGAVFRKICRSADVPCQTFYNHSDVPGGSTLGNISTSHVSMNTVDIGLPQLAMHSPYETAGVKDTEYLIRAVKAFYQADVICRDGWVKIKA